MKLIASMVVHNERGRYLDLCLSSLLGFCDEVRILDDGSTDDLPEYLQSEFSHAEAVRLFVKRQERSSFFQHEGQTRQALYRWTLEGNPTHVLAIDADEFIGNGALLRREVERDRSMPVWVLMVDEVWSAWPDCLCIRTDGSWGNRRASILYRVTEDSKNWHIANRALACGREPVEIKTLPWKLLGTELLHFGWTKESERVARHARYAEHDGGRFHVKTHLDSILWPDDQVTLGATPWPFGLLALRSALLSRLTAP